MDTGFYAACAGLRAKSEALDVVANNVANLNSTGYRAHQTTFRSLLMGERTSGGSLNRAVNNFGVLGGSRLDLSAGSTEQTGNPFDLAIEGDAFFEVLVTAARIRSGIRHGPEPAHPFARSRIGSARLDSL